MTMSEDLANYLFDRVDKVEWLPRKARGNSMDHPRKAITSCLETVLPQREGTHHVR